jgi:hypothetical protein
MLLDEEQLIEKLETDKRTEQVSVKVPEILKNRLDKLPSHQRSKLNKAILITMARYIHENEFDPNKYLGTRDV